MLAYNFVHFYVVIHANTPCARHDTGHKFARIATKLVRKLRLYESQCSLRTKLYTHVFSV